ncbi:hypothetical protein BGZ50_006605, partial [Haplosporangium sp. Z 11]
TVFLKLLDTYPRLNLPDIKDEVKKITNCVPRELVYLSAEVKHLPDPISLSDLQEWTESRTEDFLSIAEKYYNGRSQFSKSRFYSALLQTFLRSTSSINFEWDFMDLGLIYRRKDVSQIGIQRHILCRPAHQALLKLLKSLALPDHIKQRIRLGHLSGDEFEGPNISLGHGHDKVLCRGYKNYPRFDYMLGPMFIQVSISDFSSHNESKKADITKAFSKAPGEKNQIERYLNEVYGPGHSAEIVNNRFVVTRTDVTMGGVPVPVPGFRIVYIRGSPGKPEHRISVKKFPDVVHVTFEELKEKLFKNIL